MRNLLRQCFCVVLTLSLAMPGWALRKPGEDLKPGFNLFSKEQDIQLGRQAAAEVGKQYKVVDNRELQDYIGRIGRRLAAQKDAGDFPYSFTLVVDPTINAFALPGGPTFIHTGLILAADNEAEVAGVLAHEMSHVALRHGTNQASKANLMQIPAILAGAVTGSNLLAQLTNIGAMGFILKFSRTAESQADLNGTHIMSEAGYNPIEMAHFFEKLEAEGGSRAPQFLSDHPNPGNRVKAVEEEIRGLPQRTYNASEGDFPRMKALVAQIPKPPARGRGSALGSVAAPPGATPSGSYRQLKGRGFALSYPDNWQVYGDNNSAMITIAPPDGLVQSSGGSSSVGYGAIVSFYFPESRNHNLQSNTDELVQHLHGSNPSMALASRDRRRVRVDGSPGMVTTLMSNSPFGGRESDALLTVDRPEGLFYMIFITPEREFPKLQNTFNDMLNSIRFSN